jgi:acetyltransferase-like isoleucine patch superfamily enzyme
MRVSSLPAAAGRFAARMLKFGPPLAAWRLELPEHVQVEGRVWLPGGGRVVIGRGVRLVGRRAPIELRAHEGGEIVIGDGALIEDGTSIEATRSVRIGAGARIGAFCKIVDNHFHHTVGDRFERPEPVSVTIGDGAVIGVRAVLLPGSEVGAGARVGPAQVLSFRLPAGAEFPGPSGARESAA